MGLLLAAGIALAVGCAAEKPPPVVANDEFTAAHLRNLGEGDSVLRHLEPTPEEARALAEENARRGDGDGTEPAAGIDTLAKDHAREEEPTGREKAEQAGVAALGVALTLGAMVAPYFLF
jgi:hypothetical protein